MRALTSRDFVPLAEWRYAWRLEQFGAPIPERDRDRIRPLSEKSAAEVAAFLDTVRVHDSFPFSKEVFPAVESFSLTPVDHHDKLEAEDRKVKKWLYRRGLPFAAPVILCYDSRSCVVTSWKLLIRYWRLFYYPISDDLSVFDDSLSWCVLFFHEHELHFGSKKGRANQSVESNAGLPPPSVGKSTAFARRLPGVSHA